jgi:hypothetical protein
MKKLILVFAVFMAFAVKSFAYTGDGDEFIAFYEVGFYTEWITMNSQSAGAQMGCPSPGFVEVTFYASDDASYLSERLDYPNNPKSFYWINPTLECKVSVGVYQNLGVSNSNGAYVTWGD